jgi:predicted GIY-YIG superfamily endonuclease
MSKRIARGGFVIEFSISIPASSTVVIAAQAAIQASNSELAVSCLFVRVTIHKQDLHDGLTNKYGIHMLVYYEKHDMMEQTIQRETRLKKWKRAWKVRLIQEMNPEWIDHLR